MPKDFRVYLDDILEASKWIESYLSGITYEQFSNDRMRIDAVVRNLQIIGEAVRRIPSEIQAKYPHVEWRKINSFETLLFMNTLILSLKSSGQFYKTTYQSLKHKLVTF